MSLQDGFIWPCYAVGITQDKLALAHIPEKAGRQAEMEFLDMKFDKFAPCYSQSILLAEFKENHTLLWF
jgi:hypothetical protein